MLEAAMRYKNSIMTRSFDVSPCEIAAIVFNSLIMADRTGDLIAHLIENCAILDFLWEIIRAHTDLENGVPNAALACFTNLYLRSRRTCVLVSRFLPPPLASTFALTKTLQVEDVPKYLGLATAAWTSYALYPGAHTLPVPKMGTLSLTYLENPDTLKVRDEDFQPAVVDPQFASKIALVESKTDPWGKTGNTKEQPITKTHYNLDNVEYASADDPIGEMLAIAAMMVEPAEEDNEMLDPILKSGSDFMKKLLAFSENELNEFSDTLTAETEEAAERGEKFQEDAEIEFGVAEDPFGIEVLRKQAEQLTERFSTANGEWQLFLSFTAIQPVLHRGILNMTFEAPDVEAIGEDAEEAPIAEATGFWTLASKETAASIRESAISGQEAYGSASDAKNAAGLYARDWWKQTHSFSLENGALNLSDGIFKADIIRDSNESEDDVTSKKKSVRGKKKKPTQSQEAWVLNGDAFEFGFMGALIATIDDHPRPIGGFLLLKSDKHAGKEGHMQLTEDEAFDRLAHLPVQYGPNTSADIYAPTWPTDQGHIHSLEELTDLRLQLAAIASMLSSCASNARPMPFMDASYLIGTQDDDALLNAIFFPDPTREDPQGPWTNYRRNFASQALQDSNAIRNTMMQVCDAELRRDFEFIRTLSIPVLGNLPTVFLPRYAYLNYNASQVSDNLTEENWNAALALFYKWISRLHFFEFCGVSPLGALQLMSTMLSIWDQDDEAD